MTQRELRAEKQKKNYYYLKSKFGSQNHHSFHLDLNCTQAWNLLYTMSVKKMARRKITKQLLCLLIKQLLEKFL